MFRNTIRLAFFFLLPLLVFAGCRAKVEKPPIPIPEVVLESVQIREVQPYIHATGYTEAYEFVQIPARVSGFLREIRYEPGSIVKPGDPLFLIEPNQYQAEVNAAEAALASAQAQLKLSKANLERTRTLIAQGAMTEQDLETDQAKADVAAADVLKAEADLATAQLNLSYTDVRSPVAGKAGRNLVDLGNLVGPLAMGAGSQNGASSGQSHSVLTTVAGMDPIYIYFDISDYQFNSIRKFAKEQQGPAVMKLIEDLKNLKKVREDEKAAVRTETTDTRPTAGDKNRTEDLDDLNIGFEMSLIKGAVPGGEEYPFKGIIDMTGNVIDRSTGTITLRGEIPNADYTVFPGQVCRVRVPVWKISDAVLVRQEGIGTDLNQSYVYVVDDKNIAHRRVVQLGLAQLDGTRVIEKGLEKDERYIVNGIQRVHDGAPVKPVEKNENKNGPGAKE